MARGRTWALAPARAIPKDEQDALRQRLEKHISHRWKRWCRSLVPSFRGRFAYVDALPAQRWYMPGTTREQRAMIDATPVRLCRLEYVRSGDRWRYAFFKYSNEKYAPSVVASGSFMATPEQAFDSAARVYLR